MTSKKFISHLVVFVSILGFVGCGNKGPPVQFVDGTISVDGDLLDGCTVMFIPKGTSASATTLLASGITDEKGYFRISSVEGGTIGGGTTVGEYFVSIVKKKDARPPVTFDERGNILSGNPYGPPMWAYSTPEVFELQEPRTEVPITVEIKKGKNKFNFDIKSDGSFTVNGQ